MTWFLAAVGGYFFLAFSQILDKFLLTKNRISEPAVYAFYVSLFSAFSFVFSPFGFHVLPGVSVVLYLVAGFLFTYSLLAFYYAVRDYDVARVAPLHGLFVTLTIISFSFFFPEFFGEAQFHLTLLWALALFVLGGFLVSYDLPLTKADHLPLSVVLSGFLLGVHFLLMKVGYQTTDFVNGLVWSRLGAFVAGFTLLFVPLFRDQIFVHHDRQEMRSRKNLATVSLFIFNKSLAGLASFLILYAIARGSTSLVQALNGIQYVFLLLLTIPFAFLFPSIFREHLSWSDWTQKFFALLIIGSGFYFLSLSGVSIK
jgi:drug/metabolite transporter (DMT)-like permease